MNCFFVSPAEEKESSATNGTRDEVVQQLEKDLFELYRDPELNVKPTQLEKCGGAYYSEAACSLINSIYNDKRDIQPVNTRNNGAIASIPDESAIEINCVITKEGPRPIAIGDLESLCVPGMNFCLAVQCYGSWYIDIRSQKEKVIR